MIKKDISIDFGSSNTIIYLAGSGVVLSEPCVVALKTNTTTIKNQNKKMLQPSSIKAIGSQAHELIGTTDNKTVFLSPFNRGVVIDEDVAAIMLKSFLKKMIPRNAVFYPKYKVLLCVPMGMSAKERYILHNVCIKAGIKDIETIESILASAVGANLPIDQPMGNIIVNMGAGKTEVAVISDYSIVHGASINIGGEDVDQTIIQYMATKRNMLIDAKTAQQIKVDIGCLYSNDNSDTTVKGISILSREPMAAIVHASELAEFVAPIIDNIIVQIDNLIKKCNPQLTTNIYRQGIYLCGGASLLEGLEKHIHESLDIDIWRVENPSYSCINGAGKLLSNRELFLAIKNG